MLFSFVLHLFQCREGGVRVDAAYERALGQRIRAFRGQHGLSQEQLAARLQRNGCDITRSALAKIQAGQGHIYADELACLCRILQVFCDDLLIKYP